MNQNQLAFRACGLDTMEINCHHDRQQSFYFHDSLDDDPTTFWKEYARIYRMEDVKVVATNRKARHDYFLLDTYEAGMVLQGSEIKSIRAGQISLKEAYVRVDGEQAWLVNAHIAPYDPASRENHDPIRDKKLLLHKKEIDKLWNEVRQKGTTIIPLQVYLSRGRAKLEIAVAKGKRHYDKRQSIKKQDAQRDIDRALNRK